jgi:hypothetical protein
MRANEGFRFTVRDMSPSVKELRSQGLKACTREDLLNCVIKGLTPDGSKSTCISFSTVQKLLLMEKFKPGRLGLITQNMDFT